jgi:hypothetical protein
VATEVASAYVELGARIGNLERQLKKANSQITTFAATSDKQVGRASAGFGRLGIAMKAAAGAFIVTKAIQGIKTVTMAASDLNESMSKTRVIFGRSAGAIEQFANQAAKSMGLSKTAALDAASTFAVFGKSAGLSGKSLTGFSTRLVTLSADLASFYNTSPEEAILAIGAALRGESEPIRRYGVLLDDATLKQQALAMGIIKTTKGSLTPQQRVLAAQAQILKQTSDAQGDFARTSGGAANQQRIFAAQVANAKAQIGVGLLPAMTSLMPVLNDVVQAAVPAFTQAASAFGSFAAQLLRSEGFKNLLSDIGTIAQAAFTTLGNVVTATIGPLGLFAGALSTAASAIAGFGPLAAVATGAVAALLTAMAVNKVIAFVQSLRQLAVVQAAVSGVTALAGASKALQSGFTGITAASVGLAPGLTAMQAGMSRAGLAMTALRTALTGGGSPWALAAAGVGLLVGGIAALSSGLFGGTPPAQIYAQALQGLDTAARNAAGAVGTLLGAVGNYTQAQLATKQAADEVAAAERQVQDLRRQGITSGPQYTSAVQRLTAAQANLATSMGNQSQAAGSVKQSLGTLRTEYQNVTTRMREASAAEMTRISGLRLAAQAGGKGSKAAKDYESAIDALNKRLSQDQGFKSLQQNARAAADQFDAMGRSDLAKPLREIANAKPGDLLNDAAGKARAFSDVNLGKNVQPAITKLDNLIQKVESLDGKVANVRINVTESKVQGKFAGGYVTGFAGGGLVRGPGGRDRVPAMLTAGEVVLNRRQQELVNGGMGIDDALRRTGAAFAKGKGAKGGSKKPSAESIKAAREKRTEGIRSAAGSLGQAISTVALKRFDTDTQKTLRGMADGSRARMDDIGREFQGGYVEINGTWTRITGSVETAQQRLATELKSIERNFKGTLKDTAGNVVATEVSFRQFDLMMRDSQKSLTKFYDELTPAEAQIRSLQDAAASQDLAGALGDAQAKFAEAQKWGDPKAIAAAQKEMDAAVRAQTIADLQKTAEEERAQREADRQAAQDAFDTEWAGRRQGLQDALDTQLEQKRVAGENEIMLLQAQQAQRQAQEEAALANQQALYDAQRENERAKLEGALARMTGFFNDVRNMSLGKTKGTIARLNNLAVAFLSSGKNLGENFANGLTQVLPRIGAAGKSIAKILEDYLKTGSPTKKGPMSDLHHWFDGLASGLAQGVDTGGLEGAIASATVSPTISASVGSGGMTINLNVSDQTFAGMSREQADRVARDIKAALDRQVTFAL